MNELGIIVLMIVVWFPRIYQEMVRVAAMPVLPSDTCESTINRFITYFVQEFGIRVS